MKNIIKIILFISITNLFFTSCSKSDAYKEFVKDGTKVYPGKPLTFKAHAGKNRAKLTWKSIDAKIIKFHVYWNNGLDSLVVPAKNTGDVVDSIAVIIDDLEEESYVFQVVSFDAHGNRSIAEEDQTNIYSNRYIDALLNRGLKMTKLINNQASINWSSAEQTEVGVEITYTKNDGNTQKLLMSNLDTISTLDDFKKGTTFSYRTLFLPDSSAFDTVAASAITSYVYYSLDKSKFNIKELPSDQGDAWGWLMPYLWDDNFDEGKGFHTPEATLPYHFTMDLGINTKLHELIIWQRQSQLYVGANPRKFEIWGSKNPATNGSYDGWIKLMSCESVKPSGQLEGHIPSDEEYAKAGESFTVPSNSPEVRYIRFKILETWEGVNPSATHIMEVNFIAK